MRAASGFALAAALLLGAQARADTVAPLPHETPLLADFRLVCLAGEPGAADVAAERVGAWPSEQLSLPGRPGALRVWRHAIPGHDIRIMIDRGGSGPAAQASCVVEDFNDKGASLEGLRQWLAPPTSFIPRYDFVLVSGQPRLVIDLQAHEAAMRTGDLRSLTVSDINGLTGLYLTRRAAAAPGARDRADVLNALCSDIQPGRRFDAARYGAKLRTCAPSGSPEARLASLLTVAGFQLPAEGRRATLELRGAPGCRDCGYSDSTLEITVQWTIDPGGGVATIDVDTKTEVTLVTH